MPATISDDSIAVLGMVADQLNLTPDIAVEVMETLQGRALPDTADVAVNATVQAIFHTYRPHGDVIPFAEQRLEERSTFAERVQEEIRARARAPGPLRTAFGNGLATMLGFVGLGGLLRS